MSPLNAEQPFRPLYHFHHTVQYGHDRHGHIQIHGHHNAISRIHGPRVPCRVHSRVSDEIQHLWFGLLWEQLQSFRFFPRVCVLY